MKKFLLKLYKHLLIQKIYRFLRGVCQRVFLKLFPNAEINIQLQEALSKNTQYELELIQTNNKISIYEVELEGEKKNKAILEKKIEKETEINKYLFDKQYLNINKKKIRVGFLVFYYEHWDSLESIYKEMLGDDYFEPIVFIAPRKQFVDEWRFLDKAKKYFKKKKIKTMCLYDEEKGLWQDLFKFNLDLVFVNSPWEGAFPEQYWVENIAKYCRVCYIPYGIMAAQFQQSQFNLPFHHKCWKIFAESPFHRKLYKKYSDIEDTNVVVSGYPKMDFYKQNEKNDFDSLWKRNNHKRIIWAPHWSEGNVTEFAHGSFLRLYKYFYKLAEDNPTIELLIKPHPGLWDNLVAKKLMSQKQVENMKQKFINLSNVQIYEGPGYFPYFISSDALILDSISFISEYIPTKKPVFFITKDDIHKFNEYGEIIMKSLYKGWEEKEIAAFINEIVVLGNDKMYNARIKALEKYIYIPSEGVDRRIVNYIKKWIFDNENL